MVHGSASGSISICGESNMGAKTHSGSQPPSALMNKNRHRPPPASARTDGAVPKTAAEAAREPSSVRRVKFVEDREFIGSSLVARVSRQYRR